MAILENGGIILLGSSNRADSAFSAVHNDSVTGDHRHPSTKPVTGSVPPVENSTKPSESTVEVEFSSEEPKTIALQEDIANGHLPSGESNPNSAIANGHLPSGESNPNQQNSEEFDQEQQVVVVKSSSEEGDDHNSNNNGEVDVKINEGGGGDGGVVNYRSEGFKQDMRDLEEMLSKLNPMAKEFVPPSLFIHNPPPQFLPPPALGHFGYNANGFLIPNNAIFPNGNSIRRKKSGYSNGKRRMNSRTSMAQREEVIRRTVYVSDIDHQVTEEQLATLFLHCGQVVDCRVCGDPNSVLRFAFIEFTDEEGAYNALSLSGTMLGFYPVKVQPSKTAIAPVNPTFLPQSEDEREMCARTIYCTNIDKKVTPAEIKIFFETMCGEVQRLRLLGDYHHSTRIAFVEFVMAESAIAALNCSGAIIGSLPLRVSPSKTPVRSRPPRPNMH